MSGSTASWLVAKVSRPTPRFRSTNACKDGQVDCCQYLAMIPVPEKNSCSVGESSEVCGPTELHLEGNTIFVFGHEMSWLSFHHIYEWA